MNKIQRDLILEYKRILDNLKDPNNLDENTLDQYLHIFVENLSTNKNVNKKTQKGLL